ncbi:MAG TPA: hypothetical protein VMG38_03920 [Trebonia sp.]|nr:hypothetical protein [Trebonia sp.]
MSPVRGLTFARRPFSRRRGSELLLAADTERLLARRHARPGAPAMQQALAELLDWAAGPASDEELAGEAAAVATFVLATGGRAARPAPFLPWARRASAIAAGLGAAIVTALSVAATADALPAPVQELAHTTFGAPAPPHPAPPHPAPRHSAPPPRATVVPSRPVPSASPSSGSQHGKGKALGKKATAGGPGRAGASRRVSPCRPVI